MDDVVGRLFERADALMESAPGRVRVRRLSHVDDVRLLRTARAALSDDERLEIDKTRIALIERLHGAVAPQKQQRPTRPGLLGRVLAKVRLPSSELSMALQGNHELGPDRLPAPVELIDAAEAWLLAELTNDRVEEDVAPLAQVWNDASIEPVPTD